MKESVSLTHAQIRRYWGVRLQDFVLLLLQEFHLTGTTFQ